jgi:hypothetical protein
MLPAVQSQAPARRRKASDATGADDRPQSRDGGVRTGPFPDLDELRLSFDWPPPGYRAERHL